MEYDTVPSCSALKKGGWWGKQRSTRRSHLHDTPCIWVWTTRELVSENRQRGHFSSVQSLSYVRLCDPMNRSTPGLPVHHQLLEFTQTHVHRVGGAIQPSHPLSSPSPPAPSPSQHQSLVVYTCDSPAKQPTQPRVPPAHRSTQALSLSPSITAQVAALPQHSFRVGHHPGHRHRSSPGLGITVMSRDLFSSHLMNPSKGVFPDYLLLLQCFLWLAFIAYLFINIPPLKVKSQRRCEWPCSTPGLLTNALLRLLVSSRSLAVSLPPLSPTGLDQRS